MSDNEKEYVAILPHSWGCADHKLEAVRNAIKNYQNSYGEGNETVTVGIYEVSGEWEITPRGGIRAENFHSDQEQEVKVEHLNLINDLESQLLVLYDELMLDGEIEDQTLDELNRKVTA